MESDLRSCGLLDRCRAIATGTWSDALDSLSLPGVLSGLIHRSGAGRVAGRAVTVREVTAPLGTYTIQEFAVGQFLAACAPDTILVIALDGAAVSTFGGLAARGALNQGVAGVVIDGACRDLADIRQSGLWLASRHVTPTSGKRRAKVQAINAQIECAGVTVQPGDIVVADETGIVCLPSARVSEVLTAAEELTDRDARFEALLRQGRSFEEAASALHHL